MTDFYRLSQAEFKIVTLRCKRGHFGTDYGKLSLQRLLLWLEDIRQECRFERAGVDKRLLMGDVAKPASCAEDNFGITDLFTKVKDQLIAMQLLTLEERDARHDETISRAQRALLARWDKLQLLKSAEDSPGIVINLSQLESLDTTIRRRIAVKLSFATG